jgi:hypothetical protein
MISLQQLKELRNILGIKTGILRVVNMRLFKCNHDWVITENSNVLQQDSMGYPLRLYISKCTKCGSSRQEWIDVAESALKGLDTGEFVLLKWEKYNG